MKVWLATVLVNDRTKVLGIGKTFEVANKLCEEHSTTSLFFTYSRFDDAWNRRNYLIKEVEVLED